MWIVHKMFNLIVLWTTIFHWLCVWDEQTFNKKKYIYVPSQLNSKWIKPLHTGFWLVLKFKRFCFVLLYQMIWLGFQVLVIALGIFYIDHNELDINICNRCRMWHITWTWLNILGHLMVKKESLVWELTRYKTSYTYIVWVFLEFMKWNVS